MLNFGGDFYYDIGDEVLSEVSPTEQQQIQQELSSYNCTKVLSHNGKILQSLGYEAVTKRLKFSAIFAKESALCWSYDLFSSALFWLMFSHRVNSGWRILCFKYNSIPWIYFLKTVIGEWRRYRNKKSLESLMCMKEPLQILSKMRVQKIVPK